MKQVEETAPVTPVSNNNKALKRNTAAELQSHTARTQNTLVNTMENAEVTKIKRAVIHALIRLRNAEIQEFDAIARLVTQITDENNKIFRRKTVSHGFRTAMKQECWCGERGFTSRCNC